MGEVSNIVSREISYAKEQFNNTVENHKIFRLNRYRNKHNIQRRIGKRHPIGQQYTENGTGSTYRNKMVQQALTADSDDKTELTKRCEEFLIENYYVYPVFSRNKAFALSPNCSGITYSTYLGVPIFESGERYD